MLQGCILFSRAHISPLRTLQAQSSQDVMEAMRLAINLVLEGDQEAEGVTTSPASVSSVNTEQEEEEEDVEIDSPGDNTSEGVACMQHSGSACASYAKRSVL